ncbi:MAG: sugar phosphate isomerase/epimerase [Myxococcales bacterium]|nr:sugar phosphate isomerase/epimerase [Myxococcales bacterium]
MKLGVCAQVLYHLPFEQALAKAAELGVQAIELPVDSSSPFINLEEALEGGWRRIAAQVRAAGLTISALSNHQEGQLLLGPHHADTDRICAGSADEKSRFAARRLEMTAALAQRLEVTTVCGFTGCDDYSRWFPWPAADGYERMAPVFRERLLPLLDVFAKYGVGFAHECHPKQFAYNLETAEWALRLVDDHPSFGFNLDPANLMLAGMDPVVFIVELGARIRHVHGKDGERVRHAVDRSGMLAHGSWDRPGRGFRFRVPGWGDLDWRRIITELNLAGYDGVIAIEHEDPTMSRFEGVRQAVRHLAPLLLHEPIEERWW